MLGTSIVATGLTLLVKEWKHVKMCAEVQMCKE